MPEHSPEATITLSLNLDSPVGRQFNGYDADGDPVTKDMTIYDLIIQKAVEQLTNPARAEIMEEVRTNLRDLVQAEVVSLVRQQMTKPIAPTNRWGEKLGEPTTLAEMIHGEFKKWMETPAGDRYDRSQQPSLKDLLAHEVRNQVNAEMREQLKLATSMIKERVTLVASQMLTSMIPDGQ